MWSFKGSHNHFTCANPAEGCLTNSELLKHCPGPKYKYDQGCLYSPATKRLQPGENVFKFEVTNAAGSSNKYTVTVKRDETAGLCDLAVVIPNANRSCVLAATPMTPAFNFEVEEYTANVPYGVEALDIVAAANDGIDIEVKSTVTKSNEPVRVVLQTGDNLVPIETISTDGNSKRRYTLKVIREASPSSDASLCGLHAKYLTCTGSKGCPDGATFTEFGWMPGFNPEVTEYKRDLDFKYESVVITPTGNIYGSKLLFWSNTNDGSAPVEITSGESLPRLPLLEGANNMSAIEVIAPDGLSKMMYQLTMKRGKSSDDELVSIVLSEDPQPVKKGATNYSTTLPNPCFTCEGGDVPPITITPYTHHFGAKVYVGSDLVTSGSASPPRKVAEGATAEIPIKTVAQNGIENTLVMLRVTRAPSPDTGLLALEPSYGKLYPEFSPDVLHYHLNADNFDTDRISLTPTTRNPHTTVQVEDKATVSGMASHKVN